MNSYFKACPAAGRVRSAQRAARLHAAQCQLFSFSRVRILFGKKYWLFLICMSMYTQFLVWINFLSHLNT